MNRLNTYIYILLTAVILTTSYSCERQLIDEFTPIEERWTSLEDFTSSANSSKTVSINEAQAEFVIETETAIIHFKPNSIKDPITNEDVEGPIEMTYTELRNYKDLVLNNIDCEGYAGETLYSLYMINYQLQQGGKTLKLDENNPAFVYIKAEDNVIDFETVFYWEEDVNDDGWFPNTNIDVSAEDWDFTVDGINHTGSGYKMILRNIGMFKIGEHEHLLYVMDDEYSIIEATVDEQFKNADTRVYVARKDDFSLIPLDLLNGKYVHSQIRKDEEVVIFGITVKDDRLYFGKKNIIVGETNNYDLIFNEVSYIEAIDQLQRL